MRQDLAVIAPSGVVGRIVGLPGPRAAKVQLLIDRNAAAGALIGAVMKEMRGQADAARVRELILEKLS